MKLYLMLFLLLPRLASAAPGIDRREMVTAAAKLFPHVLKVLENSPRFLQLPEDEQRVFDQVVELASKHDVPVHFSADPEHFHVNPGEPRRWMRTPVNAIGTIDVNLNLLNSPEADVTLPFLLKTLFHEWAHKTGEPDWGLRDRVAQFVESETLAFAHEYTTESGTKLTMFAIPTEALPGELVPTSINRPQPVSALLVERRGLVEDATEPLLTAMERNSSVMRSALGEANRMMFEILKVMSAQAQTMLMPMAQAMGLEAVDLLKELTGALTARSKQLRNFEMHDAEAVSGPTQDMIRIKGLWLSKFKEKIKLPIKVEGAELIEEVPTPLSISLRLPHAPADKITPENITVSVRPNADLLETAKVQTINRGPNGEIARLTISFAALEAPSQVQLSIMYSGGTRLLAAKSVEAGRAGRWNASFELPWRFLPSSALIAESVLVGTNKTVYLDRLVELNSMEPAAPVARGQIEIVPESAGIWGITPEGSAIFVNQHHLKPIFMGPPAVRIEVDRKDQILAYLDAENLPLELELSGEAKVREVRLLFKRTAMVSTNVLTDDERRKGEKPPKFRDVIWGGKEVHLIMGGNGIKKQDFFEVLTAPAETIFRAETERGTQRVKTHFAVPFLPAGSLDDATQGHIPPMFIPIFLEVVLESGETLSYEFGQGAMPEETCEFDLGSS